jgi:hypothetical protein
MNNIVKLHDGSEEIVSEEELEAASQIYDSLFPATGPTAGPWGVEPEQATHGCTLVIVSRGEILARSNPVPHYSHPSQMGDMHNFTLMAAAPEMAELLNWIRHTESGISDECCDRIAAVLAKAVVKS